MSKLNVEYNFKNKELLESAIGHAAIFNSENKQKQYERLEILGDCILNAIITESLLDIYPNANEGSISRMRANLVNTGTIAKIAIMINLKEFMLYSAKCYFASSGNGKLTCDNITNKMLENTVEALIGAMFLDSGYLEAKHVVLQLWQQFLHNAELDSTDPKTKLQEYYQRHHRGMLPVYQVINKAGQEHNPTFTVRVAIEEMYADGIGATVKEAERHAAYNILQAIQLQCDPKKGCI